ncbi:hypothetical protein AM571_PC00550 (plasmid) [Rhizobium etli 8C-3]|uniref:Transmembrane protein n=1 Tax=Rhizobium etli 8C-3 TaxID=538025 RepID=A0A1L5PDL5_RHIET|nr:hypothetical protein [Rhizobium etli]APO78288.1 hypothetical protein AM571_PC00550 [Rhizobium etli 8C-3]
MDDPARSAAEIVVFGTYTSSAALGAFAVIVSREAKTSGKKKSVRTSAAPVRQHRPRPKRGARFRVFQKANRQATQIAWLVVVTFVAAIALHALLT